MRKRSRWNCSKPNTSRNTMETEIFVSRMVWSINSEVTASLFSSQSKSVESQLFSFALVPYRVSTIVNREGRGGVQNDMEKPIWTFTFSHSILWLYRVYGQMNSHGRNMSAIDLRKEITSLSWLFRLKCYFGCLKWNIRSIVYTTSQHVAQGLDNEW